jgi:hypothetical protein
MIRVFATDSSLNPNAGATVPAEKMPVYLPDGATQESNEDILVSLRKRIFALEGRCPWPGLLKDLKRAADEIEWLRAK